MNRLANATLLQQYELSIGKTDRFSKDDIAPILMGLYGEVGSLMATSKKYHREKKAYIGYKSAVEEEFGDALWYFCAVCLRLGISIEEMLGESFRSIESEGKILKPSKSRLSASRKLDAALIDLGFTAALLLHDWKNLNRLREHVFTFARLYFVSLELTRLDFREILEKNLRKTLGRFDAPDPRDLEDFDAAFAEDEQLPRSFEIEIYQKSSGSTYLRWNGVFIGDPLTDNISKPDGYRFHDVFHMAHAAVLHWSPTFRALIKKKRKSNQKIDMTQDGGRSIVIEEGLTAWLFSRAKELNYFKDHNSVSFDVLKTIQSFVKGYEVASCPLSLWEDAILQGYAVFRQVKANNGGIVIGDRGNRRISYRALGEKSES